MDTAQEEEFDAITRLASNICDTRISMINLIDKRRQWTKSSVGIDIDEIPREQGICQYTILDDGPLEVSDLTADDRFKDKNYVFNRNQYIYYAGAHLKTPRGYNIGVLCVMDTQKRELLKWQLNSLGILADEVVARLELRLKQKQLENSKLHNDEFLRIISYDMRNPLAGIIGITELIRSDGYTDSEELDYLLGLIEHSARKLLDDVNDLFDITKIESGGIMLNPKVTDLEAITNDVIELQKPNARIKKIDLDVEINHKNGRVTVDPVRYRQILGNLINNAVKFTPEGGNIKIVVEYPVDREGRKNIKVRVKDDGIGIPKKHQATLFSKADNYRRQGTSNEKSNGIGLPLVKKLVDAHNGSITLHSEPEKGSEFTICLPELSRME